MAGPILVGKLGWEDITSLRIWVRPKRLRKRAQGACVRPASACSPTRASYDAHHIVRDAGYLNWRYADSPRPYLRVEDGSRLGDRDALGLARLLLGRRCEAVGGRGCCGAASGAVDADLAVAMVNPGEERAYLAAGFVPTPRTIRFIGKRLTDDAPELPKERGAWHLTLGDLDFF